MSKFYVTYNASGSGEMDFDADDIHDAKLIAYDAIYGHLSEVFNDEIKKITLYAIGKCD